VLVRVASALSTVALVPILIGAWGVQGYGEWVALVALISYASYANFGVVTIGGNEVVMGMGAGDPARAKRSFRNALAFSHLVVVPTLLAAACAASVVPFGRILNLAQVSDAEARLIAWLALAQVAVTTYRGLGAFVLNAHGRYAVTYTTEGCVRLLELGSVATAVVWFGARQTGLAATLALFSLIELVAFVLLVRRIADWSFWHMGPLDRGWVRSLLRPGFGFFLANLSSQNILLQGPRIALAIVSGGSAVALYNVYGIVLRLADQIVLLISAPLEVEVVQAWHQGEKGRAYRLIILGTQVSVLVLIACGVALLVTGPWFFPVWTAGRIAFDIGLLWLFLAIALAAQFGRIASQTLTAANRIFEVSVLMLPLSLVAVGLGTILAAMLGVQGMALGIVAGEVLLSLLMLRAIRAWTGEPGAAPLRDLFRPGDLKLLAAAVPHRLLRRRRP
jgi:O-antigen/teichoic acid export membrane protein